MTRDPHASRWWVEGADGKFQCVQPLRTEVGLGVGVGLEGAEYRPNDSGGTQICMSRTPVFILKHATDFTGGMFITALSSVDKVTTR